MPNAHSDRRFLLFDYSNPCESESSLMFTILKSDDESHRRLCARHQYAETGREFVAPKSVVCDP
jgi:hypothetical protein